LLRRKGTKGNSTRLQWLCLPCGEPNPKMSGAQRVMGDNLGREGNRTTKTHTAESKKNKKAAP
jgi:hypothetical protein